MKSLHSQSSHIERGASTAQPKTVAYRLGKLQDRHLLWGRWLDCGCASGGYSRALMERGVAHAVGIEPETERLQDAQQQTATQHVHYAAAVGEHLPFADATFDGVLVNEVLEHVANERRTLAEVFRVLRPGGYLALMGPNRWFPFEGHGMRIGSIKINQPVPLLPWLPAFLARHVMRARNYWPGELCGLVAASGFVVLECESVFPLFEFYRWLPASFIAGYLNMVPLLERTPLLQRFGVSTLVLAQRQHPGAG